MATPLIGTVIITGANGALGSEIAAAIAETQPLVHLLLVLRNSQNDGLQNVPSRLRSIGPRSFETAEVDLTSINSVITFSKQTVQRVRRRLIPPVIVLIHCAAIASYVSDPVTRDGYDPVYQTNCLSPFLMTVGLLEAFRAGDRPTSSGARVINIGCSAVSYGRLDYFEGGQDSKRASGSRLKAREGNVRFRSSKLIMATAMYALRRSLAIVSVSYVLHWHLFRPLTGFSAQEGKISLDIFTLDPGGMVGKSHLSPTAPRSLRVAHKARSSLRPLLRLFSKSAMNATEVPAKAIARVAFQPHPVDNMGTQPYYILDDEYEAGSVVCLLRDQRQMDDVLKRMMRQAEAGLRELQSSPTRHEH